MADFGFETLEVYKIANKIGQDVYKLVSRWNWFDKDTLGKQMLRSADSVSLNICEGYGRFHYRDKKQFYIYSRASLFENYGCLVKAKQRNLISESEFLVKKKFYIDFAIKLNNFISSVGKKKSTSESPQNDNKQNPII